jgi:hypothetical protein
MVFGVSVMRHPTTELDAQERRKELAMLKFAKIGMTVCMTGIFCYGANWNGKLVDASCYDNTSANRTNTASTAKLDKECAPSPSTSAFALEVSKNKVYKLDAAGNTKAAEAIKAGAIKSDNDGDVHASVTGTMEGTTLKVDSITGKGEHH